MDNSPFEITDENFRVEWEDLPGGGGYVHVSMTEKVRDYFHPQAEAMGLTMEQFIRVRCGFPPDPEEA